MTMNTVLTISTALDCVEEQMTMTDLAEDVRSRVHGRIECGLSGSKKLRVKRRLAAWDGSCSFGLQQRKETLFVCPVLHARRVHVRTG